MKSSKKARNKAHMTVKYSASIYKGINQHWKQFKCENNQLNYDIFSLFSIMWLRNNLENDMYANFHLFY